MERSWKVPCGRPRIGDTRDFVKNFTKIADCAHSLEVRNDLGAVWARNSCWARRTADYFRGRFLSRDNLTAEEIQNDYELNTGDADVRRMRDIDPMMMRGAGKGPCAILLGRHQRRKPQHNAWMLEEVAQMALATVALHPGVRPIDPRCSTNIFLRKPRHERLLRQKEAAPKPRKKR